MRIDPIGSNPTNPNPAPEIAATPNLSPFVQERIQQVTDPALRKELTGLILEVDDRARRLLSAKGRGEFEEYKTAVKKFMHRVLPHSYKAEETQTQRKDGKFVMFLMVRRLDEALENISALLMQGQQDPMRLVSQMDEIRGLLLDLTL
jgi:uncharacterized protein YaaR (DUF327 family)